MPDESKQSASGEVFFDRNQAVKLLVLLAREHGWPAGLGWDAEDTERQWPVLFIETPCGQLSWHVPVSEVNPEDWPVFRGVWDGHTVEVKRERIEKLIRDPRNPKNMRGKIRPTVSR